MRTPILGGLAAAAAVCLSACLGTEAPARKPNVVVIFTDDQGFADAGYQGVRDDLKTPNIDALAAAGAWFSAGYVSAPQCSPSRAGLITGRYQQRFGLNVNGGGALPWSETTLAERLREAGYVTGMTGKWHLQGGVASNGERPENPDPGEAGGEARSPRFDPANPGHVGHHGFEEYLMGVRQNYVATHAADGRVLTGKETRHRDARFRIDVQTEWALRFLERHAGSERPFFLYLSYFGPHVPLEAPDEYLDRFPGEMPEPRRLALAIMAAIDDGVGEVVEALRRHDLASRTLVFFLSDNGAPLSFQSADLPPGRGPEWNGSLNEPWAGEKGMLSEGGIRIPFLAAWEGVIPSGQVFDRPVIALDVAATAVAAARLPVPEDADGVDLLPFLTGRAAGDPHPALFWRFRSQAAIRAGDWKLLTVGGERRYLFDLSRPDGEHRNLIDDHPALARELQGELAAWASGLRPPGLGATSSAREQRQYEYYVDHRLRSSGRS